MMKMKRIGLACSILAFLSAGSAVTVVKSEFSMCIVGDRIKETQIIAGSDNNCTLYVNYLPYSSKVKKATVSQFFTYEAAEAGKTVTKSTQIKPYGIATESTTPKNNVYLTDFLHTPDQPGITWVNVSYKHPKTTNIKYKQVGFIFNLLFEDGSRQKISRTLKISY